MEAPKISWRPLGQLFVEKGLLTEERLDHALAEQAATGGRLGEKLVELGYVTRSTLQQLLAEQYGVALVFETGFGTGLRAELERRHESTTRPAIAPEDTPMLAVADGPEQNGDPLKPLGGLEEQWAKLAAAEARVAEMEQELNTMRERFKNTGNDVEDLAGDIRANGTTR